MLPAFVVVICIVTAIFEPRFLSSQNLLNLSVQLMPLLIIAVGQSFTIIGGGLDLSMGAVLSFAGVVGALVMQQFGVFPGVLAMLLLGCLAGALNGLVIAFLRGSALVVTLGMTSIAQALALMLSNGTPVFDLPGGFVEGLGYTPILGIPAMVWIGLATVLSAAIVLRKTVFGRYLYAIGSNRAAAYKSGVNVKVCTLLIYVLSGLASGIGAVVVTAWTSSAQPIAAPDITLHSIAAVVLGGVALTGGRGGMYEVVCGVLILGMLSNVMNMIGVSSYFQMLAIGCVIIVAVSLDRFRRSAATP